MPVPSARPASRIPALVLGIACLVVSLAGTPAWSRAPEDEARVIDAVKKVRPSVVRVDTMHPAAKRPGVGSGVIIRKDGFIVTNHHVIRRAQVIHVWLPSGKMYSARVWKSSPERDIAILKIDASDLPVPKFGNSDHLDLGQTAIAIGSPLRFSWSVTIGIVSALGRQVPSSGVSYKNLIQTDAAINPGSSGGALVNSSGEVIGINTLVYTGNATYRNAQGLAFAIPINDALKIAQALVGNQAPPSTVHGPGWLGVEGKDVTADMADMYDFRVKVGVLVKNVAPQSPALAAGIRKGDVITELAGTPVRNVAEMRAALGTHRPGETIALVVWGVGKTRKVINVRLEALNH